MDKLKMSLESSLRKNDTEETMLGSIMVEVVTGSQDSDIADINDEIWANKK